MRRMLPTVLLLVLLGPATSAANIQVGQVGPPFAKTHVDGGLVSSGDFAGKVVVLFLFGNT